MCVLPREQEVNGVSPRVLILSFDLCSQKHADRVLKLAHRIENYVPLKDVLSLLYDQRISVVYPSIYLWNISHTDSLNKIGRLIQDERFNVATLEVRWLSHAHRYDGNHLERGLSRPDELLKKYLTEKVNNLEPMTVST